MRYITWIDNLVLMQNDGDIRKSLAGKEHRFRFYELILGTPTLAGEEGEINFDQAADGTLVTSTNDKRLNLGHRPMEAAYKLSTRHYLPVVAAGGEIPAADEELGAFWYKVLEHGTAAEVGKIKSNETETAITAAAGQSFRLIGYANQIAAGLNLLFLEAPDIAVTEATTAEESGLILNNIYKVQSGTVIFKGKEYQTGEFFFSGTEALEAEPFGEGTDGTYYRYQPEPFFSSLSENVPLYEVENFKQKILGQGNEALGYFPNRPTSVQPHPFGTIYKK
jgi:hypothetical protein